jgi:hypothetical protein
VIFAVPILIAVTLFLGWMLVTLAINALLLFSGISAGLLVLGWSHSIADALIVGALVGIAVATIGPVAFSRTQSPMLRLVIIIAFAAPAAAAAHSAVLGLLGHVIAPSAPRELLAMAAAIIVGLAAWRRFIDHAGRLQRG